MKYEWIIVRRHLCVPVRSAQPPGRSHLATPPPVRARPVSHPAVCVSPVLYPAVGDCADYPNRPCVPVRSAQPPVRPHLATPPPVRARPVSHPAVCVGAIR